MENVLVQPNNWKYLFRDWFGEFYQSEVKLIEGICYESKIYISGNIKYRNLEYWVQSRASSIIERQKWIIVMAIVTKTLLIPFYTVRNIDKARNLVLEIMFLFSNFGQGILEFEKVLFKVYHKELLTFLNNVDVITPESINEFLSSLSPKRLTARQTIIFLYTFDSDSFILKGTNDEKIKKLSLITGLTENSFPKVLGKIDDLFRNQKIKITQREWDSLMNDLEQVRLTLIRPEDQSYLDNKLRLLSQKLGY